MENKEPRQVWRKELSREIKDGKETVINEYFKKDLITEEMQNEICEHWDDDYEGAYYAVVGYSPDDLCYLDMDRLYDSLNDYFMNCDDEDKETSRYKVFEKILKVAEEYRGFTVWL